MKSITTGIFFLCAFSWSVYGEDSAKALARAVISGEAKRTFTVYPQRGFQAEKIEAVALQSRNRLNSFMLSDKAGEEIVISYAILVLDGQISFAAANDGVGATYHKLVAERRVLAERLFKLDERPATP